MDALQRGIESIRRATDDAIRASARREAEKVVARSRREEATAREEAEDVRRSGGDAEDARGRGRRAPYDPPTIPPIEGEREREPPATPPIAPGSVASARTPPPSAPAPAPAPASANPRASAPTTTAPAMATPSSSSAGAPDVDVAVVLASVQSELDAVSRRQASLQETTREAVAAAMASARDEIFASAMASLEATLAAKAEERCVAVIAEQVVPRVGESLRKLDARLTAAEAGVAALAANANATQPQPQPAQPPPPPPPPSAGVDEAALASRVRERVAADVAALVGKVEAAEVEAMEAKRARKALEEEVRAMRVALDAASATVVPPPPPSAAPPAPSAELAELRAKVDVMTMQVSEASAAAAAAAESATKASRAPAPAPAPAPAGDAAATTLMELVELRERLKSVSNAVETHEKLVDGATTAVRVMETRVAATETAVAAAAADAASAIAVAEGAATNAAKDAVEHARLLAMDDQHMIELTARRVAEVEAAERATRDESREADAAIRASLDALSKKLSEKLDALSALSTTPAAAAEEEKKIDALEDTATIPSHDEIAAKIDALEKRVVAAEDAAAAAAAEKAAAEKAAPPPPETDEGTLVARADAIEAAAAALSARVAALGELVEDDHAAAFKRHDAKLKSVEQTLVKEVALRFKTLDAKARSAENAASAAAAEAGRAADAVAGLLERDIARDQEVADAKKRASADEADAMRRVDEKVARVRAGAEEATRECKLALEKLGADVAFLEAKDASGAKEIDLLAEEWSAARAGLKRQEEALWESVMMIRREVEAASPSPSPSTCAAGAPSWRSASVLPRSAPAESRRSWRTATAASVCCSRGSRS